MHTTQAIHEKLQESCQIMSSESSQALKKLALVIRTMTSSSVADSHITIAKTAANDLKLFLKTNSWQQTDILEIIPLVTAASLLIEVVFSTVKILECVHELASVAKFKIKSQDDVSNSDKKNTERILRSPSIEGSHGHAITVE